MQQEIAHLLPYILAAGAVTVGGITAILKGYKAVVAEIREVVGFELRSHTESERGWQEEIERRLGRVESKLDELIAAEITRNVER